MRIMSFLGIILIALFLPFWVFVVASCIYTFFFQSFELLIIAFCIDAQFGDQNQNIWYMYTLVTFCILACMLYIKPHLRS